jgi:peptide deformylase
MAILKLVIAPNPILQKTSLPVLEITERTKEFCKDMLDTMYDFGGIGLSAVQVGILERIIVVDLQGEKNTNKQTGQIIMINPEIIHNDSTLNLYNEGCLSFPDQFVNIERPKQIRVRYLDLDSNQCELDADGLLSTCIQHEIDHLNGKTIASYVSDLKRTMMHAKIKKIKRTMNNVI